MWRRKNKNQKKEIKFAIMGGIFHVPLPPARFDKGTCIVLINGKEVVLDKDGLILEINVDNSRPIKLKIFPDYKNKKLDALEIIDVNDNKEYPIDSPKIEFVGIGNLSRDIIKNRINILDDLINRLEEDRLKFIRKTRRNSYKTIIILLVMLGVLLYFAFTEKGSTRYFDLFISLIDIIVILLNLMIIKKTKINKKKIIKDKLKENKINKKKIIKDKLKENKIIDITDIDIVKEK